MLRGRLAILCTAIGLTSTALRPAPGQLVELPQRLPPVVADGTMGIPLVASRTEAWPTSGATAAAYVDPAASDAFDPGCATAADPGWNVSGKVQAPLEFTDAWTLQWLPDGLVYRSYLAGVKEPRFSAVFIHEQNRGWFLNSTLGGRVGLLRYGDTRTVRPDGWQLDLEGGVIPRLDLEEDWDLESADFRIGLPLTFGVGALQFKLALYHTSAHAGDEFLLSNPAFVRINYSRDVILFGASFFATDDLRLYGEAGYAFGIDGGSEPLEFQFGIDYSPMWNTRWGGAPFAAVNGHLREEVDFGGNFVAQLGWQWRGSYHDHLFRFGAEYYNGKSSQFEFFSRTDHYVGVGIWYDY